MEIKSKYIEFRKHFEPFQVFSIRDIAKWNPEFDSRRLVEWQDKNYLYKIINGWYCFSDLPADEGLLFLVANRIYSPSYISFESGLAFYHLIPEGVYSTTAATSLKTRVFKTLLGTFSFRHIKPELLFGYKLLAVKNQRVKIAEPEKVILDFLYLRNDLRTVNDFNSLRINREDMQSLINTDRMNGYLALFGNTALERRVSTFNQAMHA